MAKTKNSDIRFQVLDYYLQRGEYSLAYLHKAVNKELEARGYSRVTASNTIRNDMDYLSANYDVEVVEIRSGRNISYTYAEEGMSIYKPRLSKDDRLQISQALSILSRFEGMPQMEWMDNTLQRLRLSIDTEGDKAPIVGFDDCRRLQGRQYFTPFVSAISNRTVLKIDYLKYGADQPKAIIISPCYLKEHSRRWFLLGMTQYSDHPIVLAFDRIVSFTPLPDEAYRPADGFDFNNEYFRDIVGVTRFHDQSPEEVLIEVDNDRLPYITTKPIHDSQEVVETGDYTSLLRLFVIPNVELVQFILSYGQAVKVISPDYLRDEVIGHIEGMMFNYDLLEEDL